MSRLLSLALALLIALTAQQMAAARGVMKDAQGQVVLCTGQGPVTVTLDSQGNPIGPVHICPDCAFPALALEPPTPTVKPGVIHIQTLPQTPVCEWETLTARHTFNARAPPETA